VVKTPLNNEIPRQTSQIDSKIKQLQNELQYKIQRFDTKRVDPRDEYGEKQNEIKKLVQQFDPLENGNSVTFRSDINTTDRHPSIFESIPANCVNNVLRNLQTNYGKNTRMNFKQISSDFDPLTSSETNQSNLIDFN